MRISDWSSDVCSSDLVLIALAPSFGYTIAARHGRWCLSLEIPSARHRQGGSDKCDGIPMDSLITAAARALAAGDLLGVLKRVGQIGRAHVGTPVTTAHFVCRTMLEKKQQR